MTKAGSVPEIKTVEKDNKSEEWVKRVWMRSTENWQMAKKITENRQIPEKLRQLIFVVSTEKRL